MSGNNKSLALILGTALGAVIVAAAAVIYAKSRSNAETPARSVEQALSEAREKIREIESQLGMQNQIA